ncbi:SsgA family sporulation/cell division regulator [Streptomyces microflavus]|nr:SsgA family sporulation/cell division regulator [Streptomyces microflavus]
MMREALTIDGVAKAIVRIQQVAQASGSDRFRACLQELTDLHEELAQGRTPDLSSCPKALDALDFVAQLQRSSLATAAAEALRARTSSATMRRIARHSEDLHAEETQKEPRGLRAEQGPEKPSGRMRTFLEERLDHWRGTGTGKWAAADWKVVTLRKMDVAEVACETILRLVVPDAPPLPVPAEFRYRTTDPYAVEAIFHTGQSEHPTWVLGREIITAGMRTHAGAGDVKVWPSMSSGTKTICISLSSPEGTALLEAPRAALQSFLRRTNQLIPPGTENEHINLDVDKVFGLNTACTEEEQPQAKTEQ